MREKQPNSAQARAARPGTYQQRLYERVHITHNYRHSLPSPRSGKQVNLHGSNPNASIKIRPKTASPVLRISPLRKCLVSLRLSTVFNFDLIVNPTLQELQAQLRDTNIRLAEAKNDEKRAALAAFKEQVELYNITQDEVMRALGYLKPERKRRAEAKYYDPSSGRSWSGRGPRPKWLEGKDLDDYLIDRAPKPWWPGEDN